MNAVAEPMALLADQPEPQTPAATTVALSPVEYAVRAGASVEQVQALFEMQVRADNHRLDLLREQRRMQEEDRLRAAELAFRGDFAAFRGENITVPKNKHVDRGRAGSFWQAEYELICQKLSPALSKHGFSFRHDQQFGSREWPTAENPGARLGWVTVICYLEHRSGHAESLKLEGPEGDQSANTPVQNMQLTASYLKRQSLLAITGTATGGEDDEGGMRGKKALGEDGAADDLIDAGREHAMQGMEALLAWWKTLNAKQRNDLGQEFRAWRDAAQKADAAGVVA